MSTTAFPHHPEGGPPSFEDATPAEVRAALIPEERAEFDRDWRAALAEAADSLDLAGVFTTLVAWRRVARLTVTSGPAAHRAMYRRAAAKLTGETPPVDEPLERTKARLGF